MADPMTGWLMLCALSIGFGTGISIFIARRTMVQDNRVFDFNQEAWKLAVNLKLTSPLNTLLLLPSPVMRGWHWRRDIHPNTFAGLVLFPWLREMFYVPSIEALERVIERKMTHEEVAAVQEILNLRSKLAHELARDMEKSVRRSARLGMSTGVIVAVLAFIGLYAVMT